MAALTAPGAALTPRDPGQRLVVVVGQPKTLAIAVRGARARRRWSTLGEWLSAGGVATSPRGSVTA